MGTGGKALLYILGLGLLGKILLAIYLPLGVDESYTVAVAREFSLSFFDHPPLGFWSPVLSARLFGESALAYRLPFLVYGLGTGFMLYKIGQEIASRRVGLWAAFLYNITPFFILSGGFFVVPDGPLDLSLAVAVWALLRIEKGARLWPLVGVALAFAFASKYQAVLFPLAVVLYAALTPARRVWFRQSGPYIASAIAMLGLLPVLVWNAQHDWVSFTFQGGRGGFGLNLPNFARMLAGQAVYLLPVVYLLLRGLQRGIKTPELRLLAFVAVTPIAVFNLYYLFAANSLPHWPMTGWLFSLPLAALLVAERRRRWPLYVVGVLVWALIGALTLHARTGVLTPTPPPDWDQTMEVFDWSGLEPALRARGLLDDPVVLAVTDWQDGGRLSTALGGRYPVRVIGSEPHHFRYLQGWSAGSRALLLRPVYLAQAESAARALLQQARAVDPAARPLAPVILTRGAAPYIAVLAVSLDLPQAP